MTEQASANALILIADFVNIDAAGKANVIGGGIQHLGSNPDTGMTAPFSLFVSVTLNIPSMEQTQAVVEILLVDADGRPVVVPGHNDSKVMRFSQAVDFHHAVAPGVQPPPLGFPGSSNVVLNFPSGLPLPTGSTYEWVVQLDGTPLAATTFFVPGVVE